MSTIDADIPVRDKKLVRIHPVLFQEVQQFADKRGCTYSQALDTLTRIGLDVINALDNLKLNKN